jgi:hypothetical protein
MSSRNDERCQKLIEHIKMGGTPAICGTIFTAEQVKEIQYLLNKRKSDIDLYFILNIKKSGRTSYERGQTLIEDIKMGKLPAICGTHLTEDQLREIQDLLIAKKRYIDYYFEEQMKVKAFKRTPARDALTTKYKD